MSAALDAELLTGSECGPYPFLSLVHRTGTEQDFIDWARNRRATYTRGRVWMAEGRGMAFQAGQREGTQQCRELGACEPDSGPG